MCKITIKDKIEIYKRRLKGETISSLSKCFNINTSTIKYLIKIIEKHGYDILRKDKNRVYSTEFKLQAINRVLFNKEPIQSVSVDIGLVSTSILYNCLLNFKENDYNLCVSTYVEKEDKREIIDIKVLNIQIEEIDEKINKLRISINEIIKELENE